MSLSVQCSVIESFSFRGENVQSAHVPDLGECLVGIDVSRVIGYVDDNNRRRAIKRHVPQKYTMQIEDVKDIVERHVRSDVPQDNAILLKEPDLYCFPLRMRKKREKNCGHKYWFFVCVVTGYKKFLTIKNYKQNVFCHAIYL